MRAIAQILSRNAGQRKRVMSEIGGLFGLSALLVGRVLQRRGILVEHIRGDGQLMHEEALAAREKLDRTHVQVSMFDAPKEAPWRSVRPVWPKNRQPGSPER